jgi:hypothetical protein
MPSTNLSKAIRHTLRRLDVRDHPSLGATRQRATPLPQDDNSWTGRGRGEERAHGSPDSATQRFWNAKRFPWGNFGALHLGEGETYSGDFRESRESARVARTLLSAYPPPGPRHGPIFPAACLPMFGLRTRSKWSCSTRECPYRPQCFAGPCAHKSHAPSVTGW